MTATSQLLLAGLLSLLVPQVSCFISNTNIGWLPRTPRVQFAVGVGNHVEDGDVLDADYERVAVATTTTTSPDSRQDTNANRNDDNTAEIPVFQTNSLLDLTLVDNNVTFPFVDPQTEQTINCRLAVSAKLEDEQLYAVGIPSQHGVLMVIERGDENGQETVAEYLDPDVDDHVEVFEIMAGALQKYLGSDLALQRTPRILTISGDLDKYVDALPGNLVSTDITLDKIMEEPDGDLDKLFDFFKEQMGDEVFEATMAEAADMDPSIMALFETSNEDDSDTPFNPAEMEEAFRNLSADIQHQGVGVKLVGFQVNNNDEKDKSTTPPSFYSLVKPIKPLTVVGRLKSEGRETVFELLTPEEEVLIVPRLEQICKEDMEAQGLL